MATLYFGNTLINQADANVATVVKPLTKAEYAALAVKDPNTLYVITDAGNPVTVEQMNAAVAEKAPTSHAVDTSTYGIGTNLVFGHVKLSSATTSTSGPGKGIAATPAAVKEAYDLASEAKAAAVSKAPMYSYGTEDLTAGSSTLETGKLYFVYE